jgi:hypothetical protein
MKLLYGTLPKIPLQKNSFSKIGIRNKDPIELAVFQVMVEKKT